MENIRIIHARDKNLIAHTRTATKNITEKESASFFPRCILRRRILTGVHENLLTFIFCLITGMRCQDVPKRDRHTFRSETSASLNLLSWNDTRIRFVSKIEMSYSSLSFVCQLQVLKYYQYNYNESSLNSISL